MNRILTFVLIAIICFNSTAKAHIFRNYQMENGLSHNSVWAVIQDGKGFMWFGTNEGLNRFDGKTFKIYKTVPGDSLSIGSNFIHTLFENSHGQILVGTKCGLYLFDATKESFHHINLGSDREEDVVVNRIMEDSNGNFWIACHGQGIYLLTPELQVKRHFLYRGDKVNDIPSNFIWTLIQDHNGVIWIGSDGEGLIRFDIEENKFTRMSGAEKTAITDKTVYSLYCDADNNIWIGTSVSGLCRYNYRTGKTVYFLNRDKDILNIKAITNFSDNELIMGSDKGLIVFNRQDGNYYYINDNVSAGNISNKSVFDIAKDREGAFWIATYFSGVNYFSPAINKFSYYGVNVRQSHRKNIISSFAEDANGKIWIGTKDDGVTLFNPKSDEFEEIGKNIGYHDIQQLLLDGDNLWLSLYSKGVTVLNLKNNVLKRYVHNGEDTTSLVNDYVFAMTRNSNGEILLGTGDGVAVYNAKEYNFRKINEFVNISIKDIEKDYKGNLWFATHRSGIYCLSPDGQCKHFIHNPMDSTSLPGNNVNCIHQDAKRRIWVGTEGNGIAMFDSQKGCFESVMTEASGFPSNIIYDILDDVDGNLWISTGGGLAKVKTDTWDIRTFGYVETLQKIRYNLKCALHASDNRLYFGGTNGFISFNPREITDNENIPPVIITGFQVSNIEVKPGKKGAPLTISISDTEEITLEHNQSTFSFDFVALSYLSPGQNQYAYMLEGFDKDWNYVGNNNRGYYMNIPPGKYIFRVKASNNDGLWNDTDKSIVVIIKRPFWLSNLMIAIYVLLLITVVTLSIKRYIKRLEIKNQQKIYKYTVQKEKEVYESKINFFTNIAHEIRTPLSLIVAPLETLEQLGQGNQKILENLGIIGNNARRLLDLVNQLIDFRKVEEEMFRFNFRAVNVVDIVQKVYNQYVQSARLNGIDVNLNIEKEEVKCKVDAESIYKIVSNFMSNAVKYAKSKITLSVGEQNNNLIIFVEDDGNGISPEHLEKIFEPFYQIDSKENMIKAGSGLGLSLSKSLAAKHNGQILVQSEKGSGSTFKLQIPMAIDDVPQIEYEETTNEDAFILPQVKNEDGQHILVVEDNVELRRFLINNMKDYYTVFEACNGVEALNIIEKEEIDMIISDILMPEMDGIELCKHVKSNPAYSYIPVILLSAKTDISSKIEGLECGADIYMEKPFSIVQLLAQISSIIENRNNIRKRFQNSPLQYYKENKEKGNTNVAFVNKLNSIILEHITDESISIEFLAESFSMSRSNVHKKVKNITGITPNEYIRLVKLNKAAQLLATGKYKVSEVCYMVGFNTPSYFSKCFSEQFGKLPKDYICEI